MFFIGLDVLVSWSDVWSCVLFFLVLLFIYLFSGEASTFADLMAVHPMLHTLASNVPAFILTRTKGTKCTL